jgi:hypothetical protein
MDRNRNRGRRHARPASIPLGPRALSGAVDGPARDVAAPLGCDQGAIGAAAAWLVRRHRVRPILAATIALHAGLDGGERRHG